MEQFFISNLMIEKVRHLENISIPLSDKSRKHLILTGCNGSGKTSVLDALSGYLDELFTTEASGENLNNGISAEFNRPISHVTKAFLQGQFILGYYKAERIFQAEIPKHIEKVKLKDSYTMSENTGREFVKYLADLQVMAALAGNKGEMQKADAINHWFVKFEDLLRKIFNDESLQLIFDEDTFNFIIRENNREPFDFNTLSSGYSAVLDIVLDLILRMGKNTDRSFVFDVPGIVLIDEIETHLHLEMQRNVLKLLTTVFPDIQFIISTHSPFVLDSLQDVAIYDLERKLLVSDGLENVPYSGIVEGYFRA